MILTVGHVGNNEAVAAGDRPPRAADQRRRRRFVVPRAVRAAPRAARALGRRRSSRGATCARSSACSGASEMLAPARRLGLPQRRHPGPAVRRLDDAAGRPGDARGQDRRRGSCRSSIRRQPDGRLRVDLAEPDRRRRRPTRPSSSGRPRRSPTRSSRRSRAAPEQWYSFKPIWPATRRGGAPTSSGAALADAGRAGRTRARPRGAAAATEADRVAAATRGRRPRDASAGRLLLGGVVARLPPARGPARPARRASPATSGTGSRPARAAQARREPAPGLRRALAATGRGSPARPRRRDGPARARAARPLRVPPRRALLPRGRPDAGHRRRAYVDERLVSRDARSSSPRRFVAGQAGHLRRPPLRLDRAAGALPRRPGRRRPSAPDGDHRRPGAPGLLRADARRGRASGSSACARRAASCSAALRDGDPGRARRRSRPHRRRDRRSRSSGRPAPLPIGPGAARRRERRADRTSSASGARATGHYRGRLERGRRSRPTGTRRERVDGDDDRAGGRVRAHRSPTPPSSGGRSSSRSGRTSRHAATGAGGGPRTPVADAGGARRRPGRLGRADLHIHTLASRRDRRRSTAILDHVERATDLDVIAITDHERIDAAVAARAMAARPRPARSRSSSARRSRRSAATCSRCSSTAPIRPFRSLRDDDRRRSTSGRPGDPGPPARARTRCAPRAGCSAGCSTTRTRASTPTRSRRSTRRALGRPWHRPRRPLRRRARPRPRRQQRRPRARARSAPAGRRSRAGPPRTCGAAIEAGTTAARTARSTRPRGQLGTFGRQLRKHGRDARDEVGGRVRRDGTGRDHGYPGGRHRPPRFERRGRRRTSRGRGATDEDRARLPVRLPASRAASTQHVRYLYENLRLRGHDVRIITASHGLAARVRGRHHPDRQGLLACRSTARSGRSPSRRATSPRSATLLERERFDLLHFHEPFVPFLSLVPAARVDTA